MTIRALLVEDEPLALRRLRRLLRDEADVKVVGTCGDVPAQSTVTWSPATVSATRNAIGSGASPMPSM